MKGKLMSTSRSNGILKKAKCEHKKPVQVITIRGVEMFWSVLAHRHTHTHTRSRQTLNRICV